MQRIFTPLSPFSFLPCRSGNLLLCDGCSNVAHPQCLGLKEVPDGDWFCPKCVEEKGFDAPAPRTAASRVRKPKKPHDATEDMTTEDATPPAVGNGASDDTSKQPSPTEDSKPPAEATTSSDASGQPKEASKKPAPPPEITDEQFEEQELALHEVIESLSSQHPEPVQKPRPKKASVEEAASDD